MNVKKYAKYGGCVGLTLSVAAFFLAGAGHGTYIPAWLFFAPLVFFGWHVVFLGGGIVLYAGYAVLMSWGNKNNKRVRILLILLGFHFGAVGLSVWFYPEVCDYENLKETFHAVPFLVIAGFIPFILVFVYYKAVKSRDMEDDCE